MTVVINLLDRLRQAPMAAVNRKRKVAQNLRHDGKRNKAPRCMSEPKTISVYQRVQEFSDECFVVSANKLFCTACRDEVCIKKASSLSASNLGSIREGKYSFRIKANVNKTSLWPFRNMTRRFTQLGKPCPQRREFIKLKWCRPS